ncbi:glutamate receptor ionotropic, delta-2-like [Tigriopus californicus]|uniref:glutamate receptor ionotropic, delta-2-like n=1 Tax=Tigriopus californicus TaxID=6832 RepID=UPI0027D9F6E8|nr:glutamate receptor ionotropic, delta-2-like [Tigriopus californicus]
MVLWGKFKDLEKTKSFPKTVVESLPFIRGSTIIVAYANYYPHFKRHSNGSISGFYADVLKAAQTYLGVHFEYIPSVDGHWGSLLENGSYNGMVGMVERREVDMALPEISYTYDRSSISDYPFALNKERQQILVQNTFTQNSLDLWTYMDPYSWWFWYTTLAMMTLATTLAHLFQWVEKQGPGSEWMQDLIYVMIGIGITTMPKCTSSRIFFFWCALLGYVFVASYTSVLSASLIVKRFQVPYADLSDLANQDMDFSFLIRDGSAAHTFYRKAQAGTIANKLWKRSKLFKSVNEGIQEVMNSRDIVMQAAVGDFQYLEEYPCEVYAMPWNAMTDLAGLILQKNSPYTQTFKELFLLLEQSGQLDHLRIKWKLSVIKRVEECDKDDRSLGFSKCVTAFLVVPLGVVLALVMVVIEKITMLYRTTKSLNARQQSKWP